MLDQEYDPEFDEKWLTADDWLTCFSKSRETFQGESKDQIHHLFKDPNLLSKTYL